MSQDIKISVVLAVHNEEKNLARCLESVRSVADEIVIVDGESSDDTVAIAKKFDATVIETTNKQNFHINKQMAIDAAQGDLILQMDADEAIDTELSKFIEKISANRSADDGEQPVAWWLKRKNHFLGHWMRKGGQYPDPVIRLFFKGKAQLPMEDVHEQMKVDGETGTAHGHLLHYPNPTYSNYLKTSFDRYTSWTAQQWYEKGQRTSWRFGFEQLIWQPLQSFFQRYLRHKGFMDGLVGFVFAASSALHHPVAYLKLWEKEERARQGLDPEEA